MKSYWKNNFVFFGKMKTTRSEPYMVRNRTRNPHPFVKPSTQLLRARIQRLYADGYSIEDISTIVDRSVQTVKAAVRFMPQPGDE